jgi:hypothetical protein
LPRHTEGVSIVGNDWIKTSIVPFLLFKKASHPLSLLFGAMTNNGFCWFPFFWQLLLVLEDSIRLTDCIVNPQTTLFVTFSCVFLLVFYSRRKRKENQLPRNQRQNKSPLFFMTVVSS